MFFSTIFPLNFLERCFLGDLYLSFCLSRSMRLAQAPFRPGFPDHLITLNGLWVIFPRAHIFLSRVSFPPSAGLQIASISLSMRRQ